MYSFCRRHCSTNCDEGVQLQTTYTCGCGYSYIGDEVDALGHDYEAVVTAPTCTHSGYTTYTCACGNSKVSNRTAAIAHAYVDGYCVACGKTKPVTVADSVNNLVDETIDVVTETIRDAVNQTTNMVMDAVDAAITETVETLDAAITDTTETLNDFATNVAVQTEKAVQEIEVQITNILGWFAQFVR